MVRYVTLKRRNILDVFFLALTMQLSDIINFTKGDTFENWLLYPHKLNWVYDTYL